MPHVKIEKDGLYRYDWDGEKRRDVRTRVKRQRVFTCLRDACEIADGVTLGDIFRIVARYKSLCGFISAYSWCWDLEAFHAQAEDPPGETPLQRLEVYWDADLHEYDGKRDLDIGPGFHAFGVPEPAHEHATRDADGLICYGLTFSPMTELAALPVRLNTSVEIRLGYAAGQKPLLVADRDFTLQDVLDAIYWEISFLGGPADKTAKHEEVVGIMEDYKAGVIDTVPFDAP